MLSTMPTALRISTIIESMKTAPKPAQATKKMPRPMKHAAMPSPPPKCVSDVAREGVGWLMGAEYSRRGGCGSLLVSGVARRTGGDGVVTLGVGDAEHRLAMLAFHQLP